MADGAIEPMTVGSYWVKDFEWLSSQHYQFEAIITLYRPEHTTWFAWWKTVHPESTIRYRGDCTVWHDADTGERASSAIESELADVWTKAKWERKDRAARRPDCAAEAG